jgi:hypothetical protein
VKWFPLDSDNINDPKIKTLLRLRGRDGYGGWMMLCSYVADHGGSEPGLGFKADGDLLDLDEIRDELLFDTDADLLGFIDCLADRKLIHAPLWTEKKIIFIPGMWNRQVAYARGKGRSISTFQTPKALADAVLTGTAPAIPAAPDKSQKAPKKPAKARKVPENPLQYSTRHNNTEQKEKNGSADSAADAPPIPKAGKDHPIRELLRLHETLFMAMTKARLSPEDRQVFPDGKKPPGYTAGDAKMAGNLIQRHTEPEARRLLHLFFESPDPFIQQSGYGFGVFFKCIGKLTVNRPSVDRAPTPAGSGRTRLDEGKYANV